MTSPRSNVSAVVVCDRLYAVGGFSGKTFLNTIEYLDPETNEWTTFVSQQEIDLNNIAESLKEAVENGMHGKSPVPPPTAAAMLLQNGDDDGAKVTTNGTTSNGHHDQQLGGSSEGEEDDQQQMPPSVKVINGDVLYSTSNGKLDEDAVPLNGYPRVAADSDADADELTAIVQNGSS